MNMRNMIESTLAGFIVTLAIVYPLFSIIAWDWTWVNNRSEDAEVGRFFWVLFSVIGGVVAFRIQLDRDRGND